MSDKKSCINCNPFEDRHCRLSDNAATCNKWQRNPDMWLSILPVEAGWYWRKTVVTDYPWIEQVCNSDIESESIFRRKTDLWQGPIKPREG
jgi:hypothetical protein